MPVIHIVIDEIRQTAEALGWADLFDWLTKIVELLLTIITIAGVILGLSWLHDLKQKKREATSGFYAKLIMSPPLDTPGRRD